MREAEEGGTMRGLRFRGCRLLTVKAEMLGAFS